MTASAQPTGREAGGNRILKRLSLRTKIIGAAVLVVLALLVIAIPGDQNELVARQQTVEGAQAAYDLAYPAVAPMMESVLEAINGAEVDLAGNRLYSGLSSALTTFNRATSTLATRFQGVVTFSTNVHSLLDGNNAVAELDTEEFRVLVSEMDTTLSVALLALMELNDAIDEYNGYQSWVSASIASSLFGLPQGYTDPVPASSRLTRDSLTR